MEKNDALVQTGLPSGEAVAVPDDFCDPDADMAYGCLFCMTGHEDSVAMGITQAFPDVKVIVPKKVMFVKLQGQLKKNTTPLFAGYVCFRASVSFNAWRLSTVPSVFRLLKTEDAQWRLYGNDAALVKRFFDCNGVIDLSTAFFEGDRIVPVDGLLKEYEGQIVRVNRRKQKVQVRFQIRDKVILAWLGYDEIDKNNVNGMDLLHG